MNTVAHIALVPRGSRVDMSQVASVAAALSIQIVRDFSPIWGISATVSAFTKPTDVPVGFWPIYIEDSDKLPQGASGVHLDSRNQPYALIEAGDQWSLDASHECLEMLVDPWGNKVQAGPLLEAAQQLGEAEHQVQYLVEICDPIQDGQYGYQINGVLVSDFFTPSFYDPAGARGVRYDFTGALSGPREIGVNGCLSWLDPVTDSMLQVQNFYGPDRRLHPQVVNLSRDPLFQEVLLAEAFRPAVDRVTETPNLLSNLSGEQRISYETHHRAVRHASQLHAKRMEEELSRTLCANVG